MKKLVMSALLIAAVSQAAGCIFVSDDDGSSGTNSVDATWSLVDLGAPTACPAGATTATVYAQRASDSSPFADIYDCADGGGSAADLPDGDYVVWVELTDDSGATLYAESEDASISLAGGENAQADFTIDAYNGFWDVGWNLFDAGGAPEACADVANDGISVLSTNSSTTEGQDDLFDCAQGENGNEVTLPADSGLPIGDYTVVMSLLDPSQAALGESTPVTASIDYGNDFVDLGIVDIQEGQFN
jgi:hypothetical protein